jgi:outer membrane lipoprotein carrier protein
MHMLIAATVLIALLGPIQTPAGQSAAEVAAAVQRKYDQMKDFSADFTQTHTGGPLGRKRVEQGAVVIKRPGRMRWEYKSPEKKLFVSNGKRLVFHDPGNNQVTLSEMPEGDDATSAALFLTGRGNLTRDFNVSFLPNAAADTYALKLEPKRRQTDFDWLELVVDRQTLQLRTLTAIAREAGRDSFAFSSVKENVGAADKIFEFEIPRGAEVIHAGRGKS